MTPTRRAHAYRILLALSLVAVAYGLLTDAQAVLCLGVANAVLGNGLATLNTSRTPSA